MKIEDKHYRKPHSCISTGMHTLWYAICTYVNNNNYYYFVILQMFKNICLVVLVETALTDN